MTMKPLTEKFTTHENLQPSKKVPKYSNNAVNREEGRCIHINQWTPSGQKHTKATIDIIMIHQFPPRSQKA